MGLSIEKHTPKYHKLVKILTDLKEKVGSADQRVYVRNLSKHITIKDFNEFFEDCAKIRNILFFNYFSKLNVNNKRKRKKQNNKIAVVTFVSEEGVKKAIAKCGQVLVGTRIQVFKYVEKPKKKSQKKITKKKKKRGNQTPSKINEKSKEGDQTLSEINEKSEEGNQTPNEINEKSKEGNQTPNEINEKSKEGNQTPNEINEKS